MIFMLSNIFTSLNGVKTSCLPAHDYFSLIFKFSIKFIFHTLQKAEM